MISQISFIPPAHNDRRFFTVVHTAAMISDNDRAGHIRVSRKSGPNVNDSTTNQAQSPRYPERRRALCLQPPETTGFAPYCLRRERLN